jgi:hypothetical protein
VSATFDFSEVERLSASLATAARSLPVQVRAVVTKAALNVKTETRDTVSHDPSWKRLAQTVNFDMEGNAFYSRATIGYDDQGQGELAGIYEFGSARRDPHPTLIPAFDRERPRFEQALTAVAGKVIEDAL